MLTGRLETVLLDAAARGATGCLYVRDGNGDEAEVFLREGLVYAVSVPGRRMMLGARLLSCGALTPEALAESLEIQRTELQGWRLGELLVHLGYVERAVVESYVVEQLTDGVTALLGWPVSRWRFRTGRRTRQDVAPPIDVESLLREVGSRLTTWAQLAEVVGGPRAVVRLSTRSALADEVVLGPNDWALLCKVDGERSVSALAADCGFTLFEAGCVVAHLVSARLVDVDPMSEDARAIADVQDDGAEVAHGLDDVLATVARVSAALDGPYEVPEVPEAAEEAEAATDAVAAAEAAAAAAAVAESDAVAAAEAQAAVAAAVDAAADADADAIDIDAAAAAWEPDSERGVTAPLPQLGPATEDLLSAILDQVAGVTGEITTVDDDAEDRSEELPWPSEAAAPVTAEVEALPWNPGGAAPATAEAEDRGWEAAETSPAAMLRELSMESFLGTAPAPAVVAAPVAAPEPSYRQTGSGHPALGERSSGPTNNADTAALLRELSSLGDEDEPAPRAPQRSSPIYVPASAAARNKRRGLFGRG